MQPATIEFWIPSAEVPEGADPAGLQKRITAELAAFEKELAPGRARVSKPRKRDVPPDAAGVSELVSWGITFYFEHRDEVHAALPLLTKLLSGISAAARYFMPRKKKQRKGAGEPVVRLRIGDREITLPAESESIDDFVKRLSELPLAAPEERK